MLQQYMASEAGTQQACIFEYGESTAWTCTAAEGGHSSHKITRGAAASALPKSRALQRRMRMSLLERTGGTIFLHFRAGYFRRQCTCGSPPCLRHNEINTSTGHCVARLELLQQLLALHDVPEHRVPPVQQVGPAGRQLRLLRTRLVCCQLLATRAHSSCTRPVSHAESAISDANTNPAHGSLHAGSAGHYSGTQLLCMTVCRPCKPLAMQALSFKWRPAIGGSWLPCGHTAPAHASCLCRIYE